MFIKPWVFESALTMIGRPSGYISVMLRSIRSGDVVLDVGANTGAFTILFAHSVGSCGHVHAFEPVTPTFRKLFRNISRSPLSNRVILNKCAISDHLGRCLIRVPADDFAQASLIDHSIASWSSKLFASYDCAFETLDNYASVHSIRKIHFVKIDVEGAEMLVLNGMRNILTGPSPPILMLEAFPPWMKDFGFTPDDLFSLLKKAGYIIFFIGKHTLIPCRNEADVSSLVSFPNLVDFLCLVPEIHRDRMISLTKLLQQ